MSCFRVIRIALILSTSFLLLVTPQLSFGCPQADSVQDDQLAEVNGLIRELRDSKFAVREAAAQKLTRIGAPAVDALKLATESDSLEVRVRAQSILSSISRNRNGNSDDSYQSTINQFIAADVDGRATILRAQTTDKNASLFLRLLDIAVADEEDSVDNEGQVESSIQELITETTDNPLTQWAAYGRVTHRWSEIKKILTHPGILKYSPMLRVNAAHNAGQFESYIDNLFQKYSQAKALSKTISSRELLSLVGLLRVQQDFERADTVIGWLSEVGLQQRLRKEILFQRGDWKEILRRTKLGADDADFIAAGLLQQALLHYLLEDEEAVEEAVQALRQQLQTEIEAAENADEASAQTKLLEVKNLKRQLRVVGMVTLNWPLMEEFFDTDSTRESFQLLVLQNRPAKAIELLGIGPQFKDRQAWMQTTLKELVDANAKLDKKSRVLSSDELSQLSILIAEKQEYLYTVAEIMEQWGLDDEAQLYYQMIFSADQSSQNTDQREVLEELMQLGRTSDYWQLVASLQTTSTSSLQRGVAQQRIGGRNWYGIKDHTVQSLARQWDSRILGENTDPLIKAQTLAAIMNSPWVDREKLDFDFDVELARLRTRSETNASGEDEFLLAQVLELNGRDEAAERMVTQSVKLGCPGAIQRRFEQAIIENDLKGILKYWLYDSRGDSSRENSWLAEEAALKLLATETDLNQIRLIKEQLAVCQLAIATQWAGASGWGSRWLSRLDEMKKSHLAILRLQCMVYGVSGDFRYSRGYHRQLGEALLASGSNRKYQGGIELATAIFDELEPGKVNQNDLLYSFLASSLNVALAQGMVERKEYDRAADLLVRLAHFSAGDVSAGEVVIKELDRVGATEAADRIYNAIGKNYTDILANYPESPLARNNFAWLSASTNRDLEMARRHALVAVRVRPDVEQYLDTLAEIEFLLGRPKAAFELSKRCVQLKPSRFYYRQQKERFRQAMAEAE